MGTEVMRNHSVQGLHEVISRELFSPEETARALNVGRTTVFQLLAQGALPSVRIGKLRRIPARAVRDYVDRLVSEQCPDVA
jgi:excisionase family DNA binding protein